MAKVKYYAKENSSIGTHSSVLNFLFDMYEEGYFINSFGDRCWYKQPQSEHDEAESL